MRMTEIMICDWWLVIDYFNCLLVESYKQFCYSLITNSSSVSRSPCVFQRSRWWWWCY